MEKSPIQVPHIDLLIPDRWRSPTTLERVKFSPSQKGHQQNCQYSGDILSHPSRNDFTPCFIDLRKQIPH